MPLNKIILITNTLRSAAADADCIMVINSAQRYK